MGATGSAVAADAPEAAEIPLPIIERSPFDRITLNSENDDAVIETELLDLPDRRVPSPLPKEGELEFHRLQDPSFLYKVTWIAIAKIELYEDLVREEAERQIVAGDFDGAFGALVFLRKNYPKLPGLEPLMQQALWREASALFVAGKPADAAPVLAALARRNPRYDRLPNAVEAVARSLIETRLREGDYAGARTRLDAIASAFSALELPSLAAWRQRFERDAQRQLDVARAALADQEFAKARAAVNDALAIRPEMAEAREVWKAIQAAAPEIRVGVFQSATADSGGRSLEWAAVRARQLLDPRLVELVDFGAEGGVYRSTWADLATDDVRLDTSIMLTPAGRAARLSPQLLSLRVAESAAEDPGLAAALGRVALVDGQSVIVSWQRRVLRPEALVDVPLRSIAHRSSSVSTAAPWLDVVDAASDAESSSPSDRESTFRRAGAGATNGVAGPLIVEQLQADDAAALTALRRGDVDVLDRIAPWQHAEVEQAPDLAVAEYRLPTVHLLIPNPDRPLMAMREVRRALCYAIDRERIVREIVCSGTLRPGFQPLSGPFVAGTGQGDPTGYGSDQSIEPWPYEPRLAMVLANVARASLAKREASGPRDSEEVAAAPKDDAQPKEPPPLTIVHSTDPIARAACQAIKAQLSLAGIPTKLVETDQSPGDLSVRARYDLAYVELAPWEPLVDARRLFGRDGLTPADDPLMYEALEALDRAETWNDARAALKRVHSIAHQSLPVIPLWQTHNALAYRRELAGIGERPIALYQNVARWKKALD